MKVEREFWAAMADGLGGVASRLASEDRACRLGAAWFLCARSFGRRELPTSGQRQLSLIGLILTHEVRGLEILAQDDPAPNVRVQAILSLSRLVEADHPTVTSTLAALSTDDPDERVRVAAIEAMALRCPSQRNARLSRIIDDSSTNGERLRWNEVPRSIQSGTIAVRARLVQALADDSGAPLPFWLSCAFECHKFHGQERLALPRVAAELRRYAERRTPITATVGALVTMARTSAGKVLVSTTTRCACGHHWGVRSTPDPTKKLGLELLDDPDAQLWQALTELDPTFDPEVDEVARDVRRNLHYDDSDHPSHRRWPLLLGPWRGDSG